MPDETHHPSVNAEAVRIARRDYVRARARLLEIEKEYATEHGGESLPGSPLVPGGSPADIAAAFIRLAGEGPVTFQRLKQILDYHYVPYKEQALKTALKMASKETIEGRTVKKRAIAWLTYDGTDRPVRDDDRFDVVSD